MSDFLCLDLACSQRPQKDAEAPQTVFPLLQVYSLDVRQVPMNTIREILSARITTNLKLLVVYPISPPSNPVKTIENS